MKKLFLFLLFTGFIYKSQATISQIRWGSSGDPLTGLTVTWSNTGTADSIKWGYTTSFEKGKFKSTSRTGYTSGTLFFKYVFPTVTAGTTIYYELYDSNAHTWGSQQTFGTAPDVSNTSNYTFCAMGDCRDYPATLTTVTNLATARKPAFVLFNGDLTLAGNSATQYNTFFTAASNFLANSLVYHVEGNHDAASPTMFSNLWDLPKTGSTNLYYSFRYGNTIFISLNSNDTSNTTQFSWLKSTLATAASDPTIIWKVVSFHHAFFNTGSHTGDMDNARTSWWKAFDDYGVDLVLNGHDHNYQRTYPINLKASPVGTPVAQYGSNTGEGRLQIISGGAGAGLYSENASSADYWSIAKFNKTYNYVFFNVQGCKITITDYDQTNAVVETLTLDKTASPSCVATVVSDVAEKANSLSISPNPMEGAFTLHYTSAQTGDVLIKIYDVNGKEVISQKAVKTGAVLELPYDLSGQAKGIYSVSVIMGEQKETTTMILK